MKANKGSAFVGNQFVSGYLWFKFRNMFVWKDGERAPGVQRL